MKKIVCSIFVFLSAFFIFAEKPIVKDIQVVAGKGTKINIFWTLPENSDQKISELYLYRSTKQITSYSQIEKTKPVAKLTADYTGYTDSVKDYNTYYYAVISVTDTPCTLVLLSMNSTVSGTAITIPKDKTTHKQTEYDKYYPDGTLRETPLPYLDLIEDLKTEPLVSNKAASDAATLYTENKKNAPLLKPYLFQEDLVSPDAGSEYLLFEILKEDFVQKKYHSAITRLEQLIGTNIPDNVKNRAVFYLGESLYFSDDFEKSVRVFVTIRNIYPSLTKQWIDSALSRL